MTFLGSPREDWRYTVGVVSGGHFLSHVYFLVLPPLFPVLGRVFDLNNVELGLVVSVMSVVTLLQVPVGGVGDRVGAKWVFVAGLLLTAAGIGLVGLAPSYPVLLLFVAVAGLGQSAFHPADYAMVDTVTDTDTEGKGFGAHTFSGYAGFAAAPVVVSTVSSVVGWRYALVAVGCFGVVYAFLAALALDTVYLDGMGDASAAGSTDSFASDLFQPALLALFGFFVVLNLANNGVTTFTSILIVEGFDQPEVVGSVALTAYFTLATVGIVVGGVLADRYPPRHVICGALGVAPLVAWFIVSGLFPVGALTVGGLFGMLGFFFGLVLPSRDRLVSEAAPAGATGASFGFVYSGITVGGIVGPVLLGSVIDATTAAAAFVLIGCFYLGATGIALRLD